MMEETKAMGAGISEELRPHTLWYACRYTPLELLAGLGAEPRLAEVDVDSFERAEALAHPNLCGYGKGLIERLTRGDVHEVVLVTCCDVVKRVYDVLAAQGGLDFLYLLDLPHRRGPAEQALFHRRLEGLAKAYADYAGTSFDMAAALGAVVETAPRRDRRATLLGAHASPSLVAAVGDALGLPVENATCTGRRRLAAPPAALARAPREAQEGCAACDAEGAGGEARDDLARFLDWYARALLNQVPCMRFDDVSRRAGLVGQEGQRAVVYHTMKFCDYYGFEHAALAEGREVPMTKVETDGTAQGAGQLRTRLEAFGETIGTGAQTTPAQATARRDGGPTYVLGADSGSTSTEAVVMDGAGQLLGAAVVPTGVHAAQAAEEARRQALAQAGITEADLTASVSTGYGRGTIAGQGSSVTEITCHARGARWLAPQARTVIDIGGQDSKVIHLTEDGSVDSFVMNDKCAAGTGRFLEATARAMGMGLDEFCQRGLAWKHDVRIASTCTVFAESEVVSLVAEGTPAEDIIHGLCASVARKTATLAGRAHGEPPYLMTGGVAKNAGVVEALGQALGAPVATHEDSQLCGAIGAALIALDSLGQQG